jgi:hypothetical protein
MRVINAARIDHRISLQSQNVKNFLQLHSIRYVLTMART